MAHNSRALARRPEVPLALRSPSSCTVFLLLRLLPAPLLPLSSLSARAHDVCPTRALMRSVPSGGMPHASHITRDTDCAPAWTEEGRGVRGKGGGRGAVRAAT